MIQIQLQHGGNPNFRSNHQERTSQNGAGKDQGSLEMKDTNQDKRCRKFPRICKLLQKIHPELQLHCETIKQTKKEERMEIERRISMGLQ